MKGEAILAGAFGSVAIVVVAWMIFSAGEIYQDTSTRIKIADCVKTMDLAKAPPNEDFSHYYTCLNKLGLLDPP